ncbi:conserved hypothetical protein [Treponema phagedenis]|uniref:Uncharacterized protein n=1 Tax=Treponema phagedenis TaxID=162 RepID=A0A0B7GR18_TREPH|nr:conserved hypothetical protein [Treponema phagedenis]
MRDCGFKHSYGKLLTVAKLVGEVTVNFQNFAVAPCRTLFYNFLRFV